MIKVNTRSNICSATLKFNLLCCSKSETIHPLLARSPAKHNSGKLNVKLLTTYRFGNKAFMCEHVTHADRDMSKLEVYAWVRKAHQ